MTGNGPAPRAVIFDLDGTLTEPLLDFDAIRREIGLAPGLPILEQLDQMDPGDPTPRARAEAILRRHKRDAIRRATLSDGCVELLARLAALDVPTAILTRNMREVVEMFAARFGLGFAAIFTREDGPPKPSPVGALHLCRRLGVAPTDALAVGDYKFDILAGRAAGCRTALVTSSPPSDLEDWGPPDMVVPSLRALLPLWGKA